MKWEMAIAWGLRLAFVVCLACWLVPVANTYESSPTYEQATFKLGWPTAWYEAEIRADAGIIAHPPDFKIEHRPLPKKGPEGIWLLRDGSLDTMPSDLPSFTGWNPAVARKRTWINPIYGPIAPTVIGFGCLFVAGRLSAQAYKRTAVTHNETGTPPTEI